MPKETLPIARNHRGAASPRATLGWGRDWGEPRSGCGGGLVVCEAVLGPEVKE